DPATQPHFYDLPSTNEEPRVTRHFRFERGNGQWQINGKFADCNTIRFRARRNTAERWILENKSGGWQHPTHIHLEELQILKLSGKVPAVGTVDRSRKDVVGRVDNATAEVFLRFRDFRGDYPMHCHNVVHEDHAMLLVWAVDDVGDEKKEP